MNTHEKFLRHIDALTKQSISMRAIAKKAGMDYTRLRNVYYASVKTDATEWELKQLEKAYRSELLLDYTKEERGLIEELQTQVDILKAKKDGYKKIIQALTEMLSENPEMEDYKEVREMIEELKKLA